MPSPDRMELIEQLTDLALIQRTSVKEDFLERLSQILLKRLTVKQALMAVEKAKFKSKRFPTPAEFIELAFDRDALPGELGKVIWHCSMCQATKGAGMRCNTMIRTSKPWPQDRPCLCEAHEAEGAEVLYRFVSDPPREAPTITLRAV